MNGKKINNFNMFYQDGMAIARKSIIEKAHGMLVDRKGWMQTGEIRNIDNEGIRKKKAQMLIRFIV